MQRQTTTLILLSLLIVSTAALIWAGKVPAEHLAAIATGVMGWLIKSPRDAQ